MRAAAFLASFLLCCLRPGPVAAAGPAPVYPAEAIPCSDPPAPALAAGAWVKQVLAREEFAESSEAASCDLQRSGQARPLVTDLSPFWAQDLIGADLAKDFLGSGALKLERRPVRVADVDSGFDKNFVTAPLVGRAATKASAYGGIAHGTQVVNLIAGRGRYGVGDPTHVEISDFLPVDFGQLAITTAPNAAFQKQALENAQARFAELFRQTITPEGQAKLIALEAAAEAADWSDETLGAYEAAKKPYEEAAKERLRERYPADARVLAEARLGEAGPDLAGRQSLDAAERAAFRAAHAASVDKLAAAINGTRADVINLEIHALPALAGEKSEALNRAFERVASRAVLLASAGNFHKLEGYYPQALLRGAPVIVVGSLHPTGLTSLFSNDSPDVTVLAPSDSYLYSPGPDGKNQFGGTSGAAPLVTGAVANALTLLRPVSAAEAKLLVENTAVPLPYSGQGRAGMVNAYRLARYAERLRYAGWPKRADALLGDPALRDFSGEAEQKLGEGRRRLNFADCEEKLRGLKLTREAFLLRPTPEAARALAAAYRASDFPADALFFEAFGASEAERHRLSAEWSTRGAEAGAGAKQLWPLKAPLRERNEKFFSTPK